MFRFKSVMASLASPAPHNDANGNNDSGYAPSNLEEPIKEQASSGPNSPRVVVNKQQNQQQSQQQQPPQAAVVAHHKDGSVSFSKSAIKTFTNKNGATSSPRQEKLPMKWAIFTHWFIVTLPLEHLMKKHRDKPRFDSKYNARKFVIMLCHSTVITHVYILVPLYWVMWVSPLLLLGDEYFYLKYSFKIWWIGIQLFLFRIFQI